MARWLCNSPLPGAELKLRGIVKTGMEFSTPDDPEDPYFERARESWIPLDSAAEKLVAQAKKDADKLNEQRAKELARRRQLEEDAKNGINTRPFETKPNQVDQHFGLGIGRGETVPQDEEIQKRNDAWTKQVQKEAKKGGASDEKQAVQDVVREHQALAGGAAAQPVADPNDLTGAAEKDGKGSSRKADEKAADKKK
jgi:hypothetical protein